MKINWLITIFLTTLIACQPETSPLIPENTIVINPEEAGIIKLSTIAESIRYVPLETKLENYTGSFSKIVVYKNKIIAQGANKIEQFISIHDLNGNLLGLINGHGKGPGEFLEINDFLINPYNDQIELMDGRRNKKIYRYDLNGAFIQELALPIYSDKFAMNDPESYYIYNIIHFGRDDNPHNLIRINYRDGAIIGQYIPGIQLFDDLHFCQMINYQNKVGIRNGSRDSIFFIDENGKSTGSFFIDLGPKQKEYLKLLSKLQPGSKESMELSNRFAGRFVTGIIRSSDDFLYIPITKILSYYDREFFAVLYNWVSQEIIYFTEITNDLDHIPLGGYLCGFTTEKEMILMVNLEKTLDLSTNPPSKEFKSLMSQILPHPESDTPVLAFVKLR